MKTKFSAVFLAVLFLLVFFSQGYAQEPKLDLKKIADKITITVNSADPVAITNLYAQDAVMIQPNEAAPVRGHDALLKNYETIYKAFPDWKVDFSMVICSGDTIVFEGVGAGTFTGPLATPEGEVAPTGKKASLKFVMLAKISPDGLIAEDRTYFDNMEYMKQLGLLK